MSERYQQYESETVELIDDIRRAVQALPKAQSDHRDSLLKETNQLLSTLDENIEQMELEARLIQGAIRQSLLNKIKQYQGEYSSLKRDFESVRIRLEEESRREALFGGRADEDMIGGADQRARLLHGSDLLNDGTERLREGHQQLIETESIAVGIIDNLHSQGNVINSARNKLGVVNQNITRSRRIMGQMMKSLWKNKLLLWGLIGSLIFIIVIIIYFKFVRHHKTSTTTPLLPTPSPSI